MDTIKFLKDDVIFFQNAEEDFMYDIQSGKVGIYVNYRRAGETLLTTLSAGDFVGEMGMVEARPRSATAVALEDSELNKITEKEFYEYFRTKPEKILKIMKYTSHRMRNLTEDYLEACLTAQEYAECRKNKETPDEKLMEKMRKIIQVSKENKK